MADGTGAKGDYYVVSVAGTQTFGGILLDFGVGDWIVYNGAVWQRVEGGADGNFVNLSVSSVATFAAGAVATPAITTTGDTNTGIWFPAADTFAISTAGAERMRIDSAGNVAIGTTLTGFAVNITSTADPALTVAGGVQIGSASSTSGTKITSGLNWNFSPVSIIRAASNTTTPRLFALPLVGDDLTSTTIGAYNAIWGIYDSAPTAGSTSAALNGGMIYGAYASHRWFINGTERMRIASTGIISLGATAGAESLRVTPGASAVNYLNVNGASTGNGPYIIAAGSDTNIAVYLISKGSNPIYLATGGGIVQFAVGHTASAVNFLAAFGNSTGNGPYLQASGSDTNISFLYSAKGTGGHDFYTAGNSFIRQFAIAHTASAVNYLQVTGGATGASTTLSAQGSDTNIDLALTPKGTGVLSFGTYTAGILAQAGYITIKDAAGNTRNLLVG